MYQKNKLNQGFMLVEIMLSVLFSATLLLTSSALVISMYKTFNSRNKYSQIEDTGVVIIQDLTNSIHWASTCSIDNSLSKLELIHKSSESMNYELRDGYLLKNSIPMNISPVKVTSFKPILRSASMPPLVGIEIKLENSNESLTLYKIVASQIYE